jgi:hypothetical protein
MKKTTIDLWPRRIITVCGAIIGTLVYGFVLTGVILEAPELWREGAAAFISDAGLRLVFGAFIALLSTAPYFLLARAARHSGPPVPFAIASLLTFAVQLWLMIQALFFARSSTAPIALLFIPLYLCVPAVAMWAVAAIARRHRLINAPK